MSAAEAPPPKGGGIEQLRSRLAEIAERLRASGLSDEEAERLAREAAELAGEASAAVERALGEEPEGQQAES